MILTKIVILILLAKSFSSKLTNKEIYKNLRKLLKLTKESCGEVCNQTLTSEAGQYFDEIKKDINCSSIFEDFNVLNAKFEYPPQRIPKWLLNDFNYDGKVQVINSYRDDATNQEKNLTHIWSKDVIQLIEKSFLNNKLEGK